MPKYECKITVRLMGAQKNAAYTTTVDATSMGEAIGKAEAEWNKSVVPLDVSVKSIKPDL
jgi:hypothetical protein